MQGWRGVGSGGRDHDVFDDDLCNNHGMPL